MRNTSNLLVNAWKDEPAPCVVLTLLREEIAFRQMQLLWNIMDQLDQMMLWRSSR